jgi:hypothetical protein
MKTLITFGCTLLFLGCQGGNNQEGPKETTYNRFAYIVPQCYTKTKDDNIHNPCYSCHTKGVAPNYIDDSVLQSSYDFPQPAKINHWTNLFKSRDISNISDREIIDYVNRDNYKEIFENCYFNFDNEGFDRDKNNNYTGWRAFGYYPFLGTFWPTNGSMDDVLIRLDDKFRRDRDGNFSIEIYKINLAIVESLIKQQDTKIDLVDESKLKVDLDKNGKLEKTNVIKYDFNPLENRYMSYVGMAKGELLAPRLYPLKTEFLHTVRYIGVENSEIVFAKRLKELRYSKKIEWSNYTNLQNFALAVSKDKIENPDESERYLGSVKEGFVNSQGWLYKGLIEDKNGELRVQNEEEHLFCMGCHSKLGATTDSSFAFARKFDYDLFQNGWFHWTQKSLKNIKEPKDKLGEYEYSKYLKVNGAGDEFRENYEVIDRFFKNGELVNLEYLHQDISYLLYPSVKRALELNKLYREIVKEQSFIYGRDVTIKPNVHKEILEEDTGVKDIL